MTAVAVAVAVACQDLSSKLHCVNSCKMVPIIALSQTTECVRIKKHGHPSLCSNDVQLTKHQQVIRLHPLDLAKLAKSNLGKQ